MSEINEASPLIEQIVSLAESIKGKPLDNVQLDLLEVVAHLLTNVVFQVVKNCSKPAIEPAQATRLVMEPGHKCEVNFSHPDGPHSDYWQLATVTDIRHLETSPVQIEYKTTATTEWTPEKRVRVPAPK